METITFIQPSEVKKIKMDFVIPRVLNAKSYIIAIKKENLVKSFIYFTDFDDYIHINYSYTCPEFRRFGFSTMLRQYLIINYAKEHGKIKIVSVPFESANSVSLLKKLGFKKSDENDSYILSI